MAERRLVAFRGESGAGCTDPRYVRFPVVVSPLVPAPRNHLAKHRHETFLIDAATSKVPENDKYY